MLVRDGERTFLVGERRLRWENRILRQRIRNAWMAIWTLIALDAILILLAAVSAGAK